MPYFENAIKKSKENYSGHCAIWQDTLKPAHSWYVCTGRNGDAHLTDTSLCTEGALTQESGWPLSLKNNQAIGKSHSGQLF